ncbi:MAG: Gfo/Idh/MocA family oxidoreductase [Verrucomicrobiales bacterium]|nr:Gfo/Idh/MocA family oxidoreductase [Verrucomicrobiales bacterium]
MRTPPSTTIASSRRTPLSRRDFLATASATTVAVSAVATTTATCGSLSARAAEPGGVVGPKVKIGLVGCGGRGRWITDLFYKHGGYEIAAVHDYYADRAATAGRQFNVADTAQFSGLDGFRRLLDRNLDAVVIQSPPYFHPQQAAEAVAAGKHVYLAKPVAVDVPGCQRVEESGRRATANQRVFVVDFQTRAHPAYQEVARWVLGGKIGRIVAVESNYQTSTMFQAMGSELAKAPEDPELRLRCWAIDRVLSGDVITEQNIHAQDVVTWMLNAAPLKAVGSGGLARGFGTCWDHFSVIYTFPNQILNTFSSKQVGSAYDDILCRVYGESGTADTHYFGKVWVKSKEDGYDGGELKNLYLDGAVANIATFHRSITTGDFSNPTVAPSVRSNLTTILGRTAAYAGGEVTWADMMRRAEVLEFPIQRLRA